MHPAAEEEEEGKDDVRDEENLVGDPPEERLDGEANEKSDADQSNATHLGRIQKGLGQPVACRRSVAGRQLTTMWVW